MCDDLGSDRDFGQNMERLHETAIGQCFVGERPASDGMALLSVGFDHGVSIWVDFQLWLFVECEGRIGHSAAPSRFTVTRRTRKPDAYTASFGCGRRDPANKFWYPRRGRDCGQLDAPPDHKDGWAFWYSRDFESPTLANWMKGKRYNKDRFGQG